MTKAELRLTFTLIEKEQTLGLLAIEGDIDFPREQIFQDALESYLKQGITHLILDMAKITYINTAFGVLVKHADLYKRAGGGLAIINVPSPVKIVVEMFDLGRFFHICADLGEAKRVLQQS